MSDMQSYISAIEQFRASVKRMEAEISELRILGKEFNKQRDEYFAQVRAIVGHDTNELSAAQMPPETIEYLLQIVRQSQGALFPALDAIDAQIASIRYILAITNLLNRTFPIPDK